MEKRVLGHTGMQLSVIGFGGIVVCDASTSDAENYVSEAVDRGVNYFDIAPSYGNAEEMLGPALVPYRDDVVLACKTTKRSAVEAEKELHSSLLQLKTDYFDLYQLHGVASVDEAEQILAPGGALETLVAARDKGLIKHIGFSAHSEEAALMLLEAFDFASVMLPLNVYCWRDGGFGRKVYNAAREKGIGILALKALARRPLHKDEDKKWKKCWYMPFDTLEGVAYGLSFTLSLPVTAALSPGHADLLWLACDALDNLNDNSAEEIKGAPLFSAPSMV